jgi:hypothetical protein
MRPGGEEWQWRQVETLWEQVLVQEKPKVRRGMDSAVGCEAPGAFYRAEEGGETVSWKRNGLWRVEFFNASILGRREDGAVPISEGEKSTLGGSWFPRGRQLELGRKAVWATYCCGYQIDYQSGLDWERQMLGLKENCGDKFGLL